MTTTTAELPVVLAVVGRIDRGVSGGFIYDQDVLRALSASRGRVTLWQLAAWHELLVGQASKHSHGQFGDNDAGLMDFEATSRAYAALPPGATLVMDGFALLNLHSLIAAPATFRKCVAHVAFIQYPFSQEPDSTDWVRERCRVHEAATLARMHRIVAVGDASERMLRDNYEHALRHRLIGKVSPVARFAARQDEMHTLQPSADAEIASWRCGGAVRLVCVSNLVPRKAVIQIVRALRRSRPRLGRWHMEIVGSSSADPEYAAMVKQEILGAGGDDTLPIVHVGEVRDAAAMRAVLLRAHVLVHASLLENFCMCAAEAICCGVVLVASDVGAIRTLARGAHASLLHPAGDEAALEANLEMLLAEHRREHELGSRLRAARAYADEIGRGLHAERFPTHASFRDAWAAELEAARAAMATSAAFGNGHAKGSTSMPTLTGPGQQQGGCADEELAHVEAGLPLLHGETDPADVKDRGVAEQADPRGDGQAGQPDPEAIRLSHWWYLGLHAMAMLCVLAYELPVLHTHGLGGLHTAAHRQHRIASRLCMAARLLWLIFALTSFVDMWIFRASGLLRLSPYILHHTVRLALYLMMELHPASGYGWAASVLFGWYNLHFSAGVLCKATKMAVWAHGDLLIYLAILPQRLAMYSFDAHFGAAACTIFTLVEVGNAANKLVFWCKRSGVGSH